MGRNGLTSGSGRLSRPNGVVEGSPAPRSRGATSRAPAGPDRGVRIGRYRSAPDLREDSSPSPPTGVVRAIVARPCKPDMRNGKDPRSQSLPMSSPPRIPLGKSGLSVARFALGGNVFGWTSDEKSSFQVLDAFVDAGFNLIDTADTYSIWIDGHTGGESETIIGKWIRATGRRDDVIIATKVGMDMGPGGKGLSRDHILRSADASLKRLQTDRIDLYQAHADDPVAPLEETLRAFSSLIDQGKVRAVGASNYEAPRLEEALERSRRSGLHRYESLQPRYNLVDRDAYEGPLEAACRENGLGVLTYSTLAAGFLTGKYRSKADIGKSPRGARAEARLNDRGYRILAALDQVAERLASSPAAVALAWSMARPSVTAPIASARSVAQLEQLLTATSLHLNQDSMQLLEAASA